MLEFKKIIMANRTIEALLAYAQISDRVYNVLQNIMNLDWQPWEIITGSCWFDEDGTDFRLNPLKISEVNYHLLHKMIFKLSSNDIPKILWQRGKYDCFRVMFNHHSFYEWTSTKIIKNVYNEQNNPTRPFITKELMVSIL